MNYSITILAIIFFLSCLGNQACALVEVNSPTGGIPINITEADISEAIDFTAEADFCLWQGDGQSCLFVRGFWNCGEIYSAHAGSEATRHKGDWIPVHAA